ncbi:2-dehydro-3-deoxy-D-gluconate 5-dehydrogenase KduD [Roseateles asaccharophilus]|uniref:2-deoxy-D-gluconate 3-dehydrogenase n=1 Tax=Roseateles asaccharophilus TaxID=582607 RepID=A0ABU2A5Y0_9BURK|nr:2-dehydro-3-deoxy-D-gluconate 5-dehydrogenase KduD [Roseateles asaccharophilus]MDR7331887.1 2-deoxy-D-gluconate 3-dehydrogenase [Roseateles asaccharophilus]
MKFDLFQLKGQVAIVTGCNTGLGQGMAIALAEAGADVVGINQSAPEDTRQAVEALGRRFLDLRADMADIGRIPSLITQALALSGRIDILVNNAGIIRREDAIDFGERDWDEVIDVNLKSAFFLSQAMAKLCMAQGRGGKIINVASMLSFQGGIRVPSYTASKSGVMGLTKALANEWAAHGINVNAIAPGYMATNNTAALRADEARNAAITARIPSGRWGTPSDMAGPVVFLASQASDYVHGYTLAVDGGWLAR